MTGAPAPRPKESVVTTHMPPTAVTSRARRVISAALIAVAAAGAAIGASTVAYPAIAGAESCAGGNQFPIYDKDGKFIGCGTSHPRPQTLVFKIGRFQ
jgi:hypothetical protein